MTHKARIKNDLTIIISHLTKFTHQKRFHGELRELVKGEFYTLIRRHAKYLIDQPYNLSIRNLAVVINSHNLKIDTLAFQSYYSGINQEQANELNRILFSINPNYSDLELKAELSSITDRLEVYKINKKSIIV